MPLASLSVLFQRVRYINWTVEEELIVERLNGCIGRLKGIVRYEAVTFGRVGRRVAGNLG